jgi:hypothetical protein
MPKFVKLPVSGIILDTESIAFVARKDLNSFHVFMKNVAAAWPTVEGKDCEALEKHLATEQLPMPLVEAANQA